MIITECPHCGATNWLSEEGEEEPVCELCDNYLEEFYNPDDDEEEE